MKKHLDTLGVLAMFVGLHFLPNSTITWREVLGVAFVLGGIALMRCATDGQ